MTHHFGRNRRRLWRGGDGLLSVWGRRRRRWGWRGGGQADDDEARVEKQRRRRWRGRRRRLEEGTSALAADEERERRRKEVPGRPLQDRAGLSRGGLEAAIRASGGPVAAYSSTRD
jgi:hypothetical protein